ncbi:MULTISPECIES: hypothetical protein [unclassified Mesorhizobium]|uniref:hypothetical protein n=1 Tax=unclassified Mesorhizobium TaxID=325217 RepID=UPI0011FC49F1|nr:MULTISPECIES: hypothetical protein [unclassified Mesorhizobium]TIU23133.1 MAG: hypothetical protein E5W49_04830 [Mesorhizobium sp.]
MAFKAADQMLEPDPRYADLVVVEAGGVRRLTMDDHYAAIAAIVLMGEAPQERFATRSTAPETSCSTPGLTMTCW